MRAEAEGQGKTLKARLQVRGYDAIAQRVEAGLGVAVMPAANAKRFAQLFRIKVLRLDEPWAERDCLLAVRTQDLLPTVVQRFVAALCPATESVSAQSASGGAKT